MAYNTLNKLKWTGKLEQCVVVVLHRGAEHDRKLVSGKDITEVKRSYFTYRNGKETTIPMHRVIEIRCGEVAWKRNPGRRAQTGEKRHKSA
jgi:uncharacterized protein (UPF0248 family)